MIDTEFLYAVAQVGVTYAGFSTLVTVVAYRRDNRTLPARIYYMLLLSIIVVAFSLVPAVCQAYQLSEAVNWRISSGLFGVAWGAYWINAIVTLKKRFPVWDSLTLLNKANTAVIHPASASVLLLGASGLWGQLTAAVYATGLLVMLFMSAYLFLQIIVDLLKRDPES